MMPVISFLLEHDTGVPSFAGAVSPGALNPVLEML